MDQLIQIGSSEINGIEMQTVNARELWYFLESKQQFADWIKDRIEKFGFEEGTDFKTGISENYEKPQGGRPSKEYTVSLDMAKELAMVENNEKGRQIRKYFIEVEKQARKIFNPASLSRLDLIQIAMDAETERLKLEQKLEAAQPDLKYAKDIQDSTNLLTVTLIAKSLGTGPVILNRFLVEKGILRADNHFPTFRYQHRTDLFKIVTFSQVIDGEMKSRHSLKWTEAGRRFIYDEWKKETQLKAIGE